MSKPGLVSEFKEFVAQGDAFSMAVGIIIGGAFGAIVNSLVDSVIMPLVGVVMGGVDFSGLAIKIGEASIGYGAFIQAIINFILIAIVVFALVKMVNSLKREEEAEEEVAGPSEEVVLLTEIRDALNK